jgi:hypothetical protein
MTGEQRTADRLLGYWEVIRKGDQMPDFSRFNASAIDDIWQQCVLFTVAPEVDNKPAVLNFNRIGEKLRGIYSNEMLGRSFNAGQRHFQGAAVMRRVDEIIKNPVPLTDIGQFINDKSTVVKYRSCLLPFGRNGKVTHIVTGLSWREF